MNTLRQLLILAVAAVNPGLGLAGGLGAVWNQIGITNANSGCLAEAESAYQEALAIQKQELGPEHPAVASILNNLAALYRAQRRLADAESLYQKSLAIFEKALGPEDRQVATVLNNMGELYSSQSRFLKAEPLYQRALAILEKALGPRHPELGSSLNNLGVVYLKLGYLEKAEALHRRAMLILEPNLGPRHPDLAHTLSNLGVVHYRRRQFDKAEALFRRGLEIWEEVRTHDPNIATALQNLAQTHLAQGRRERALPLLERLAAVQEVSLSLNDPDRQATLEVLAMLQKGRRPPAWETARTLR